MSVAKLIEDLGGAAAVAEGVGADPPVVHNWRRRQRIPSDWWPAIVDFARRSDKHDVTLELLASVQAPRAPAEARA